jgi:predicted NAD-dependent protein-ADP-ribosyltransferase YbiA (DUF1768 family)
MMQDTIAFTKVRLPHGWLGNMSPHSVTYFLHAFRTAEALFQALRFKRFPEVQALIRAQQSPMAAKMIAKGHKHLLIPSDYDSDLDNMRLCLRLKVEQHPDLRAALLATGDALIVEDVSKRANASGLYWGMARLHEGWIGDNNLGKLWMELRETLKGNAT